MTGRLIVFGVLVVMLMASMPDRDAMSTQSRAAQPAPSPSRRAPSPPIVVTTAGATVSDLIITDAPSHCIEVHAARVTIINVELARCRGHGVSIRAPGARVLNSHIHDMGPRPGPGGSDERNCIVAFDTRDVLVQGNVLERCETLVMGQRTSAMRVVGNFGLNPMGPMPRGQHVQLTYAVGGEITDNYFLTENGRPTVSNSADQINLFRSSRILVARNYVKGGDSDSGCGILLSDAAPPGEKNVAEDNVLIRTAQCGVGVAGGLDHVVRRNKILDPSFPGGGGNVGIYVWLCCSGRPPCAGHTVIDNVVSNRTPDGRENPFWNGGNCGPITMSGNIFGAAARPLLTPEAEKLPAPPIPPKPWAP